MRTRWLLWVLAIACVFAPGLRAQTFHTERGAALGGIGGALAGAAIGKHNGETAAGALLGGAVGLLGGAAIGSSMDNKARLNAYQQQYQQQEYARLSRAVSTSDVMTMTRNGLSDDVISNHIRENGVQRRLEVSDVIMLHKNGVSEAVITAMQNAPVGAPVSAPVVVAPPRYQPSPAVVVEEHYYAAPYRPCPPYGPRVHVHHYHAPPPPRHHVHWGFYYGH